MSFETPIDEAEEILDRDDFIDLFRADDEKAIIALWEYGLEHYVPINLWLKFSDADAEDLWLEVYLDFYERKCPSYETSEGPFKWWARIIVKRAGLYKFRKPKHFNHISLD